jgi:hypothetical protein
MADGNRVYPVNLVVMHHSVGPEFLNSSDLTVQDWFDSVGKSRGYAGVARSYHLHPQRNKETFSQAHYALRPYTADKNKYGYRLTLLMKDPFNNVAWHAGNWPVNQRSIGIETCGNFLSKLLPNKALMLVADSFRAHDQKIGGVLNITYHRMYSATQCPGRIAEQVGRIIDMINNPKKWNGILWPPPPAPKPPAPTPTPVPVVAEWERNLKPITPIKKKMQKAINLVNIETGAAIKSFTEGTELEVQYTTTHKERAYYLTAYSAEKKIPNGFLAVEFDYVKPVTPKPEPVPEPIDPCKDYKIQNEQLQKELNEVKIQLETVEGQRDKAIKDLEDYKSGKGVISVKVVLDLLESIKNVLTKKIF